MATVIPRTHLGAAEQDAFPTDEFVHELIDGEHFVSPLPGLVHRCVVDRLYLRLDSFIRFHRLGRLYRAPFDVVFDPGDMVQPDLVFINSARMRDLADGRVLGAPDLVVEVLSPASRELDCALKLKEYASFHIPEYWIADPQSGTLDTFVLRETTYQLLQRSSGEDSVTSELLPGLECRAAEIFCDESEDGFL